MIRLTRNQPQMNRSLGVLIMSGLLLWLTGGYPVVMSQPAPGLPTRSDILRALGQQFSTITAGETPLLLVERAAFLSDSSGTLAVIPRENREFKEKFASLIAGDIDSAVFGGLYVNDQITILDVSNSTTTLKPGPYLLKLVSGQKLVAQLINIDGEIVATVPATLQAMTTASTPSIPWVTTGVRLMNTGKVEDASKRIHELNFGFPPLQGAISSATLDALGPISWVGIVLIIIGVVIVILCEVMNC